MAVNDDPKKLELFGGGTKDPSKFKQAPKQDALGNRIPLPEEEITLIEKEMQDLRIVFEQYFLGMEKKAPLRRRDILGERIRRFRTSQGKIATMLRYRFDHAQSKFMSMERVWARTLNEIENGTYARDRFKMKLRQRGMSMPLTPEAAAKLVEWGNDEATQRPIHFSRNEESAPVPDHPHEQEEPQHADETTEPPPLIRRRPSAPPSVPPRTPSDGASLNARQLEALHQAYVAARQRTSESTDGITVESLSRTLSKQVPALLKKYDCKAIDFKVVIKDNRTILKAVPRR